MSSSVPIHARNHRPGGVDPLTFPFPRARVWSTYATPVRTIGGGGQFTYVFDHGVSTDTDTFEINWHDGGSFQTAMIAIMRGGVYGLTYRFAADSYPEPTDSWEGTVIGVELLDFTPDYIDHSYAQLAYEGTYAVHSYLSTIVNHPDWLPARVRAVIRIPEGYPALTFGDEDRHLESPTLNTGSFIEVYRLGDTHTDDWVDWWFETPADEAVPDEGGTLLAAETRRARP